MQFRSPRLVRLEPFDDYLAHIGRRARREYRYARSAHAGDSVAEIPLERASLSPWMQLWERQLVEGRHPKWTYTVEQFIAEGWRALACSVAVHPLLVCGNYCYAGPPLYDKRAHPYAAKWMWFNAIRWAYEQGLSWLDLQGPGRTNWRALLEQPDASYKWIYISKSVRTHPENQAPWLSQRCACGWRQLVVKATPCLGCGLSP